ncbi:MAG: DNA-formamidopyrimidine glycosylase, partial [Anaerolineae bacterium]|nr:DNA-formamidopyrimidine glycosylase [Anaerolineae bacterium]
MPELPEVETVVRGLREPLVGRTITDVWLDWPRGLLMPSPDEFRAQLPGQTVRALRRRGK